MKTCMSALLALLLAGCHVAATAESYRWTLKAPPKASAAPKSKLPFSVEATTLSGTAAEGVPYIWVVDWVGVHGVEHQGRSYREESIRVKGGPGTAWIRILAFDRYDGLIEVARAPVEVQAAEPGPEPR
jgi:hypothetical protein